MAPKKGMPEKRGGVAIPQSHANRAQEAAGAGGDGGLEAGAGRGARNQDAAAEAAASATAQEPRQRGKGGAKCKPQSLSSSQCIAQPQPNDGEGQEEPQAEPVEELQPQLLLRRGCADGGETEVAKSQLLSSSQRHAQPQPNIGEGQEEGGRDHGARCYAQSTAAVAREGQPQPQPLALTPAAADATDPGRAGDPQVHGGDVVGVSAATKEQQLLELWPQVMVEVMRAADGLSQATVAKLVGASLRSVRTVVTESDHVACGSPPILLATPQQQRKSEYKEPADPFVTPPTRPKTCVGDNLKVPSLPPFNEVKKEIEIVEEDAEAKNLYKDFEKETHGRPPDEGHEKEELPPSSGGTRAPNLQENHENSAEDILDPIDNIARGQLIWDSNTCGEVLTSIKFEDSAEGNQRKTSPQGVKELKKIFERTKDKHEGVQSEAVLPLDVEVEMPSTHSHSFAEEAAPAVVPTNKKTSWAALTLDADAEGDAMPSPVKSTVNLLLAIENELTVARVTKDGGKVAELALMKQEVLNTMQTLKERVASGGGA